MQLLLRGRREWRGGPAAVVAADSPQAPLLWVNEAARQAGILPGMRHAAALSLDHRLQAATVDDAEIAAAVTRLHRHLLRYSPRVEPAAHEPGVFWLDARGLERLFGAPRAWAERLLRSLTRAGFTAAAAVGFTRFGSYGLARLRPGLTITPTAQHETAALHGAPLDRLLLDHRLRDDLRRLGVQTVGEFVALPAPEVRGRFGLAAAALHRLARDEEFAPLQPQLLPEPLRAREVLDEPEHDAWRLLFLIKRLLHPLLPRLAERRRAVATLELELVLADRHGSRWRERLRPAAPSLDTVLLMELVRLRLERLALDGGVERVELTLQDAGAPAEALGLFARQHRRDLAAADRALARVRAEFGDDAVACAELCPNHLPEARFRWVGLPALRTAQAERPPAAGAPARGPRPLVRRLLRRPRPVPPPPRSWLRGGPYLVSGGWWQGEVRRAYCFAADGRGGLSWLYHDARRRRWLLQGRVE
ncbi:MAG: DNA polymerase Y family protein [Candidatus Krumholzibacteriia bacterium]